MWHHHSQILRHLITPDSFYLSLAYRVDKSSEIVSLAIETLQSSDVQLQHEGLELVHSLLQSEPLQVVTSKVFIILLRVASVRLTHWHWCDVAQHLQGPCGLGQECCSNTGGVRTCAWEQVRESERES